MPWLHWREIRNGFCPLMVESLQHMQVPGRYRLVQKPSGTRGLPVAFVTLKKWTVVVDRGTKRQWEMIHNLVVHIFLNQN